jgi:aldose 1-epimerase
VTVRPSGAQFELRHRSQRVFVTEVGAGLREWQGVLDGYGVDEMARSGRGQVLIPWPNRLQDGQYEWDGERYQLPLDEPPFSIHGLVRWAPWEPVERSRSHVALQHLLAPSPGYPFTLRLRVEYTLADDGLTVRCVAENVGTRAAPFGAGFHPYIARTADDVFGAGVQRDDAERFEGEVRIADVTVWGDEHWKWVQLYTGDDRPDVARRSIAVEPMTCRKDAFRTGEDVVRLEPGAVFDARWGISP